MCCVALIARINCVSTIKSHSCILEKIYLYKINEADEVKHETYCLCIVFNSVCQKGLANYYIGPFSNRTLPTSTPSCSELRLESQLL